MSTIQPPAPEVGRQPDDELRLAAVASLEARREFWGHLTAYLLVNSVLVAIWFVTSRDGLFWPIFPIIGWGIGIGFHGLAAFQRPLTDEQIRGEMQRIAPGTGA